MTYLAITLLAGGALAGALALYRRVAGRRGHRWILGALGARPMGRLESGGFIEVTRDVARRTGAPEPWIELVPHDQSNVFVISEGGRPVLAVTRGLLSSLDRDAMEAVAGAALARAADGGNARATRAAALGMGPTAAATLASVSPADAEERGILWFPSLVMVPWGALFARLAGRGLRSEELDVAAMRGVGRAYAGARALEHMEFTAHAAPMRIPAALARLALVNPLGAPPALSLAHLFPLPAPAAARAASLREDQDLPWLPDAKLAA